MGISITGGLKKFASVSLKKLILILNGGDATTTIFNRVFDPEALLEQQATVV